jgi:hypothetical protein
MINQELVDSVLEQIKNDIHNGDYTAIEELLQNLPEDVLFNYLCEE